MAVRKLIGYLILIGLFVAFSICFAIANGWAITLICVGVAIALIGLIVLAVNLILD